MQFLMVSPTNVISHANKNIIFTMMRYCITCGWIETKDNMYFSGLINDSDAIGCIRDSCIIQLNVTRQIRSFIIHPS